MADLKISELPNAEALQNSDLIPVVQTSGNTLATRKTTIGALSGNTWNSSKKYEFGDTWFAVKNMHLGGKGNQVLVDEAPGINTIGLFATNDDKGSTSTFLKLHGDHYAALGVGGNHAFMATNSHTQVLYDGRPMLTFARGVTNLHHDTQGIVFSANEDGVQIIRRQSAGAPNSTVFGAFKTQTELRFEGKAVFSAIPAATSLFRDGKTVFSARQDYVGVSIDGNSILESGYNNSGRHGDTYNHYTELHRYNNETKSTEALLHADRYALKLFHKSRCVLDFGTASVGTANQNPFSAFFFVDDRSNTNITKKVLEASPFYTTLYLDGRQMLDFKRNSFMLYGMLDNNNNPLPLIEKHSTNNFVRFHDMSSSNPNSSVFMQASASSIRMYRDIDLGSENRDIDIGTGNWSGRRLKGILSNLVNRIAALESR